MPYDTKNPVPSTDPRDLYDTAGIADKLVNGAAPFVSDRMGLQRRSWKGMEEDFDNAQTGRTAEFQQFLEDSAFIFIGDYGAGLTLINRSQYTIRDGVPYRVAPSTTLPYTITGNWATEQSKFTPINSDDILRQDLAPTSSDVLIGGAPAADIGKIAGAITVDADARARFTKVVAGTNSVTGSAVRDAIVVYRNVTGLTDCHGFSENTIIDSVTDYGGYGSVDVTTELRGSNNQNHLFSYQSRPNYAGSGNIQHLADFLARPVHSGTGVINERIGFDIGDLTVTGGGSVDQQIGLYIRDLTYGTAKVALNVAQSTGYTLYMAGGAPMYSKGRAGFGIAPSANYAAQFAGAAASSRRGFIETTATNLQIGAEGDGVTQFISNAATRWQMMGAADSYGLCPGADNAQPFGRAANKSSVLWAGTATISTSDGRQKNIDPSEWKARKLNGNEIAAACDLAKEVGAWKFLSSIAEKGDAAREHIGMAVQRAIMVMESHGLDPYGYSFICYDKWDEETVTHPAEIVEHPAVYRDSFILDGNAMPISEKVSDAFIEVVKDEWVEIVQKAGDLYSFRETGLYAFIAAGVAAASAIVDDRLTKLEERMADLSA